MSGISVEENGGTRLGFSAPPNLEATKQKKTAVMGSKVFLVAVVHDKEEEKETKWARRDGGKRIRGRRCGGGGIR